MKEQFCCKDLEYFSTSSKEGFKDTNKLIYHNEKFDEFGIMIRDGGLSSVRINYCPWSGDKLPSSKRNQWFEELEKLGFEDPVEDFENIPNEFQTGKWIKKLS